MLNKLLGFFKLVQNYMYVTCQTKFFLLQSKKKKGKQHCRLILVNVFTSLQILTLSLPSSTNYEI